MKNAYLAALVWLGMAAVAQATADGPDFWRVTGVAADDVLNLRAGPSARDAKVGEIPSDADGVTNFGCINEMSYQESLEASEAEREAARRQRWCRVMYESVIGWVAGRFLAEGSEGTRPGTLGVRDHTGSEWAMVDLAGTMPEIRATIAFRAQGVLAGNAGCNRFEARYVRRFDEILIGDIALTRRACPEPQMRTERVVVEVLQRTRGIVGGQYALALFDGDGRLLATFRRTDWD